MTNVAMIEYRVPIEIAQDVQVQDLARQLAHDRGLRRVPIRQVVREAIGLYVKTYLVRQGTTPPLEPTPIGAVLLPKPFTPVSE